MSTAKWFVIINLTSGNGKAKISWPKIKALLEFAGFSFDFAFTESANHNRVLVQDAVNQHINNIICVGGDGTIHNTINGIMEVSAHERSLLTLGVIPIGTGNDWVKTHGISKTIEDAIQTIKAGKILIQDIGKISFLNQKTSPVYFHNLAGVGFDGYVANKVTKYKHYGSLSYLIGALVGLFAYKNVAATININDQKITTKVLMVLIGLGKYSGGGMRLTSFSQSDNSLFDVTIAKNLSKLDILLNISKLYNGSIVNHKKVMNLKTTNMQVIINQQKSPLLQADGEMIGSGNFMVSIVPKALRFYGN